LKAIKLPLTSKFGCVYACMIQLSLRLTTAIV